MLLTPRDAKVLVGYVVIDRAKRRQTPSPGQEFVLPQASYEDGLTIFYPFTHDDVRDQVCIKARDDARLNTVQAHKRAA